MTWLAVAAVVLLGGLWFLRGRRASLPFDGYYARLRAPRAGVGGPRRLRGFLDNRGTDWAVALRDLRTRLVLTDGLDGRGVIAVAGVSAEASALLTANLGLALAQLGEVLVIETAAPGLLADPAVRTEPSAASAGEGRYDELLRWPSGMIDLWRATPTAAELRPRVAELRKRYEWIVVDTGCEPAVGTGFADLLVWVQPAERLPAAPIGEMASANPERFLLIGLEDAHSR